MKKIFKRKAYVPLSRRFPILPPAWPDEVLFFLTHRCNLRCEMCGQWSKGGYVKSRITELIKDELAADKYASVLNELSRFRPRIILCGGEVLLYPEWPKFITMLARRDLPITLITNGTRLAGAAKELLKNGLEQLIVSIDGPELIHDSIRGRNGTFKRAFEGIAEVAEQKRAAGIDKPIISLNSTITKENWRSLPDVVDIAANSGLDNVTFLHPNFLSEDLYRHHQQVFKDKIGDLSSGWDGFVQDLNGFEAGALSKIIESLKKRPATGTSVTFLPDFSGEEIVAYYRNGIFESKRFSKGCLGPWKTVNIHPGGDVSPCLGYSVGNILNQSFASIWRGEKMRSFRHLVSDELPFPACSRCCTFYRF